MGSYIRLREILDERGISQSELSRSSGVSYPRVNQLYLGKGEAISLAVLDKLAEALEIDPRDLIGVDKSAKKRV